jgi:hypothetical protein
VTYLTGINAARFQEYSQTLISSLKVDADIL